MVELLYKIESYKIIGACFEVYNQKGCGFTEQVYQECLEIEFELEQIPFISQPKVELEYKGQRLRQHFVPDFVCFDQIIIEIKAVESLGNPHKSQAINYLKATNFKLAWLVNFGRSSGLERERLANDRNSSRSLKEDLASWQP